MMCLAVLAGRADAQVTVTTEPFKLSASPNREDAKATGAGRTQIANGRSFNAMLYNPALLARPRTAYDLLSVQVETSKQTPDAIAFLRDNRTQFTTGQFVKDIDQGVRAILNGATGEAQAAAVRKINRGISFTREFQDKVLGPPDDPKVHGLNVTPLLQAQVGTWGFALYGNLRSGFQSYAGETLTRINALRLPENLDNLTMEQINQLLEVVDALVDPVTGELSYKGAVPVTYAVAFLDIVGVAGYGHQVNKDLSVGANLKVVNRRFSSKIINADNYSSILSEVRSEFKTSVTGVTLDVGGLYRVPKTRLDVGLSLQNVIPVKKVSSETAVGLVVYDEAGAPVPVTARIPFELTMPFLVNLGAHYEIFPAWDASFDWYDAAAQDDLFETYVERFRFGTEYRLDAIPGSLGVALRAGLAAKRPTVGAGLNLFRVVQIDGAYAYSVLFGNFAWVVQLRIGV
jgi:hypothetical protein